MKKIYFSIALICCSLGILTLSSCATSSASTQESTSPSVAWLEPGPDYAVVTFYRPRGGSPYDFVAWDGEKCLGKMRAGTYLQCKAAPGEHIFMLTSDNWSIVKGTVVAGKAYSVLVTATISINHAIAHQEVLSPNDKRPAEWAAALIPSYTTKEFNDEYSRRRAPNVRKAMANVNEGRANFLELKPEDGR